VFDHFQTCIDKDFPTVRTISLTLSIASLLVLPIAVTTLCAPLGSNAQQGAKRPGGDGRTPTETHAGPNPGGDVTGNPGNPGAAKPSDVVEDPLKINNDPTAVSLEALLITAIDDPNIKITVRNIGKDKAQPVYVAVLAGRLPPAPAPPDAPKTDAKAATVAAAPPKDAATVAYERALAVKDQSRLDSLTIVNLIQVDKPGKPPEPEVSYVWQAGFLNGDSDFDAKLYCLNVATSLNLLFPNEHGNCPTVTLTDNAFWLRGTQSTVRKVRALLAMLDAPAPEVRMEVWAIQYSGSQADVSKRMLELNEEIEEAQHKAELAKQALAYAIRQLPDATSIDKQPAFQALQAVGFDADTKSSSNLIESLICLGVCDHHDKVLATAATALKGLLTSYNAECAKRRSERLGQKEPPKPAGTDTYALTGMRDDDYFPALKELLTTTDTDSAQDRSHIDQKSVMNFTKRLKAYTVFIDALGIYGKAQGKEPDATLEKIETAPEALSRESLIFNRQIERLIEAYASDMEHMFFQPLLDRAQHWGYGGHGGVGLAGKTDIVVNSRLHAEVSGSMEAYAERQIPNTLGEDFFGRVAELSSSTTRGAGSAPTGAAPPAAGAGAASPGTAPAAAPSGGASPAASPAAAKPFAGAIDLVRGLPSVEKALVLGALQPTAEISFYRIAPGIGFHVTPVVTPDGTAANLKLDATFGVDTNIAKDSSKDALAFRPPDAVKEHKISTVANVGGFNLFEISSFNMDSIYPRPPFITPILGNLPLLGPMFRFERGANRTFHQSVILVNAMLVPRSLSLMGFYGSNFAGRASLKRGTTRDTASGLIDYDAFINGKKPSSD